jgi:hypothetical protein
MMIRKYCSILRISLSIDGGCTGAAGAPRRRREGPGPCRASRVETFRPVHSHLLEARRGVTSRRYPDVPVPLPGAHGSGRLFSGTLTADRSQRSDSGSLSNRGMTCIWGCRTPPWFHPANSRPGPASRAAPRTSSADRLLTSRAAGQRTHSGRCDFERKRVRSLSHRPDSPGRPRPSARHTHPISTFCHLPGRFMDKPDIAVATSGTLPDRVCDC